MKSELSHSFNTVIHPDDEEILISEVLSHIERIWSQNFVIPLLSFIQRMRRFSSLRYYHTLREFGVRTSSFNTVINPDDEEILIFKVLSHIERIWSQNLVIPLILSFTHLDDEEIRVS